MDWNDTAEQAAFRGEVRALIAERLPGYYRRRVREGLESGPESGWVSDRKSGDAEARRAADEWTAALAGRGWFAPHWPKEYGGGGLTAMEQFIFKQEAAEAAAPDVGGQGVSMLGPTIIVHGSEEQKAAYLPGILSGEFLWAQGYSEPGAGSDLASLATRAVRDGDEFVVDGQKIWTSNAHHADALFALVRTDPGAPKHRGVSFLLIDDIRTPGLTVRPLINMAWEHGFNETFFEQVRVPARNVLGEVDRGWYVGMTLLDFERSNIAEAVRIRRYIRRLVRDAAGGPASAYARRGGALRAEIADRYVETEVCQNFSLRVVSIQHAGRIPNYEASTSRMFMVELDQRTARTGAKVFGLYSNLWDPGDARAPSRALFTLRYVTSISRTIAGGSSEIQRNIIATRGLGLPRS